MYRGHTVGVVVPAYDEEGFVRAVLDRIPAYVDRIYAVDDCSTDGTWREIRRFEAAANAGDGTERVVAVHHHENRGAGGAVRTGYLLALADGVDATVTVDADGQMDPAAMSRLLDPIVEGRADYAKGNRLADDDARRGMPPLRLVGNWLLTGLTKIASGYWGLRDPQNGYTAISREALAAIDPGGLFEYYAYCNQVLVRLNAAEMRVADVRMPAAYGDEESAIRYGSYVPRVSLLLLGSFLWRLRVRHLGERPRPAGLCYGFGLVGAVVGLVLALAVASGGAVVPGDRPAVRPALAVAFTVAGLGLLVTAMVADAVESRHLEVRVE